MQSADGANTNTFTISKFQQVSACLAFHRDKSFVCLRDAGRFSYLQSGANEMTQAEHIEKLEKRVKALEARIEELEKRLGDRFKETEIGKDED